MRKQLCSLVATLAITLLASAPTRAVDIYVLSNNADGPYGATTDFGRINSATGAYTSIANLSSFVANLAWNPAANNFFVTQGADSSVTLRTLTTSGTLSNSLGTIGKNLTGMAYRTANSTLYGFDHSGDDTGTINTSTGTWTVLNGSTGVVSNFPLGGRFTILNDTLYLTMNSAGRFGTIGYTASSTFQQITTNTPYATMAVANDGTTLYGIFGDGTGGNQRLYTINPANGTLTAGALITGTGLGTYFHGAGIPYTPVPEPSTYALAAIASGVMACIARRRKTNRARA